MREVQPAHAHEGLDICGFLIRLKQSGAELLKFQWKPMSNEVSDGFVATVEVAHGEDTVSCHFGVPEERMFRSSMPSTVFRAAEGRVFQGVLNAIENKTPAATAE